MYRVVDKETKIFKRDDFAFDSETEIGLNVEPSQGLIQPKWVEHKETNKKGDIVLVGEWEESYNGNIE